MEINRDSLLTRKAANLYKAGEYRRAKDLYADLQRKLPPGLFQLNINLCDKRLAVSNTKSRTQAPDRGLPRIASILDEFSFASFSPECDIIQLECGNHITQLESFRPELLLVESAWLGYKDTWRDQIAHNSENLKAVVEWCKENGIPTAFWNKEDPVHYETFLSTASQFDAVFTTDVDCVPQYKYMLKHEKVYFLPFSCQPKQLGPTEKYKRKNAFSFAGAYYTKYPERTKDLEAFIEHLPQLLPLDIFDRNYGKNDPRYMFPDEYQKYIRGSLPYDQIDRAYNGYTYSINLNSVKQSQSMFARRVFDLLATNTSVVSNYSRGLRLMLGDLCVSTDDPQNMLHRIHMNSQINNKIRLQGLRKVLSEFTSGSSLEYVLEKTSSRRKPRPSKEVIVFSIIEQETDLDRILDNYASQSYDNKFLYIVNAVKDEALARLQSTIDRDDVHVIPWNSLKTQLPHLIHKNQWVSIMSPSDYWGRNYLKDLMLAEHFTKSSAIGKARSFLMSDNGINQEDCKQYCDKQTVVGSSGILHSSQYSTQDILGLIHNPSMSIGEGFLIDPYNYCLNGRKSNNIELIKRCVDDIELNTGLPLSKIRNLIDCQPPSKRSLNTDCPVWDRQYIYSLFDKASNDSISLSHRADGSVVVASSKLDGKHEYLYSHLNIPIADFSAAKEIKGYFDSDPGLNLMLGFRFIDKDGKVISTALMQSGRNCSVPIPTEATHVKPCLRIQGSGTAAINQFAFSHHNTVPPVIISKSNVLLVAHRYPSYDNLYQNAFVHSRLKEYKRQGVTVEVFQLHEGHPLSYREFENIDVIIGDRNALQLILESNQHDKILIHFLTHEIWNTIKSFSKAKKVIWSHGSDIQPWHRRDFLYQTSLQKQEVAEQNKQKESLWRDVFEHSESIHMVFVSNYLASQVLEDYCLSRQSISYSVINNPIDTELFKYSEKPVEQRKRILSIRPYSSRVYANDLAVEAILRLSREAFFEDLSFLLIGDGILFEEVLSPLMHFPNIEIRQAFLRSTEIASLHKDYGVFLVPSRMDTQGVSRDEAMSSGLVPVTNTVAAIPEFVDSSCGLLCKPEDPDALAEAIKLLYFNPNLFSSLSSCSAKSVRERADPSLTIKRELSLLT